MVWGEFAFLRRCPLGVHRNVRCAGSARGGRAQQASVCLALCGTGYLGSGRAVGAAAATVLGRRTGRPRELPTARFLFQ